MLSSVVQVNAPLRNSGVESTNEVVVSAPQSNIITCPFCSPVKSVILAVLAVRNKLPPVLLGVVDAVLVVGVLLDGPENQRANPSGQDDQQVGEPPDSCVALRCGGGRLGSGRLGLFGLRCLGHGGSLSMSGRCIVHRARLRVKGKLPKRRTRFKALRSELWMSGWEQPAVEGADGNGESAKKSGKQIGLGGGRPASLSGLAKEEYQPALCILAQPIQHCSDFFFRRDFFSSGTSGGARG
ncbi:hypothetical protein LCGC14_3006930 [marine sediment metagenome]|uniref:Uncharacterized protein n=1 Tax=marine sediment metagenome TaxID=412755 RepID=A0A0F8Z715_9ZZZZ